MVQVHRRVSPVVLCLIALLALVLTAPLSAQVVKKRVHSFDDLTFKRAEFRLTTQTVPLEEMRTLAATPLQQDFDTLLTRESVRWQMHFDRMTGLPDMMGGEGIPWIPGSGWHNTLSPKSLGLKEGEPAPVTFVAAKALDLVRTYPSLFGAKQDELSLNTEGSGPVLDYMYYLQFDWVYQGVPVENARLVFTLNHGNLIEVGQANMGPAIRALQTSPTLDLETAWQIAYGYLGEPGPDPADAVVEAGRLLIVPTVTGQALQGLPSEPGQGLGYRLVWVVAFHREGVMGTWEARIDAHTGEILAFGDTNAYGNIKGGVYKTDKPFTEQNVPMPRANYGVGLYSDNAGNFTGTSGTTTLNGQYVVISDSCGGVSQASDGSGLIDLGTSTGLDCTTPGHGGAGNTHAARTQYWNVTQIKLKAQTYLGVAWLTNKLTDYVNLNQTCNAYWNGTSVNFFRSGGGCWNTGELPGVSLHEYGHGLDANDGTAASNGGSGETYGDITALLQTHNSCMGNGFMGGNCSGYGDACKECTGVRQLDYAKHASKAPVVPSQLDDTTGYHCTSGGTCVGPCGYECHCESYISSEAVYELATKDLLTWGMDQATAWQTVDRLWYVSRPTAASVYRCPSVTTTDGCQTGSLWRVFRSADDDDGNLNNGTPHSTALYAAFNRHVIACAADTAYNTDSTTCPALARPAVTATASNAQVLLNWNTVASASNYLVYRNETSCEAGYTKIATVAAPTTTYTDTVVVNGITYFYRIQAQGSDTDCVSPVSDCGTARLTGCTPPSAPTSLTATANGNYRIDLAWTGAGGATEYTLYRGTASGGPYTSLATVSSALTAYSDTTVYGGTTYYYVVRTFATCESVNSNQASALAGGTCNQKPTFAGLTSASNGLNAACRMDLAWSAATSNCSGTITYTVYRSRTASFTPGPGYIIATGVSGTTYQDTGCSLKQTYYYIVRARDSVSGLEDDNLVVRSAYPTGARSTIYTNGFESNSTSWVFSSVLTSLATGPITGTWLRGAPTATTNNYGGPGQPAGGHASSNCLFTAVNGTSAATDDVDYGTVYATSPTFNASTSPSVELDIWRWFLNDHTATITGCSYPDGYLLEVSNDGGTTWTPLEVLDETCSTQNNCGTNAWTNVKFLLEGYTTLTANMKFRISATDGQNTPNGTGVCEGDLVEAALDDVNIYGYATCTACSAPPTPASLTATAGANSVALNWGASAGAAGYTIYRSLGACPGTTFAQVATGVTGTSWTDTSVSASVTYSYVVRATSATYCESGTSPCAQAVPTGACTQPPAFAGLTGASNAHAGACGIGLAWSAATAYCGGAVTYDIYRSTTAGFTPGPATLLAKGISATSYSDTVGVVYGTLYYYAVRAEDAGTAGSGPSGGLQDTNTVVRSAGASGASATGATIFLDNFDSGTGIIGWNDGNFTGATTNPDVRGNMACTSPTPPSGNNIFRWGGNGCTSTYSTSVASFGSPLPNVYGIDIPWDATNVTMTFKHRYQFTALTDGATLLMQKAPASRTYYLVQAATMSGHVYNNTTAATGNPLVSYPCWAGTQSAFQTTTVNLDAMCINIDGTPCAGGSLALAFTGSSNASSGSSEYGWFIDDVKVTGDFGATSCTTSGCAMQVTLSRSAASVVAGKDIVFTASHTTGVGPYNYQWTEDGSDISGATSTTLAVNKASAQTHNYNCKVTDTGATTCTNVTASPAFAGTWTAAGGTAAPVPNSVTPTRITKNNIAATDVNVTWDASNCASTDYHIIWGDGANVATLGGSSPVVAGGKCDIGTGGALNNWSTGVPAPGAGLFVWFIVVGDDGSNKEGSWGTITGGAQRGGTAASGQCSCNTRDTTTTCATP